MIHWERVRELRGEVGEADFAEVVELFLDEVEEVLARLRNTPDPASLASDLHFVKGSAMTLGFAELGELCQSGERKAAVAAYDEVDVGALVCVYEKSKSMFIGNLN